MKTNIFYYSAIALMAAAATVSCSKDEEKAEAISPKTRFNDIVRQYYGSVQKVTQTSYDQSTLKPNADTTGVNIDSAKASSQYISEYNPAGYQTLSTQYQLRVMNYTTGQYRDTMILQYKQVRAYDDRNRIKRQETYYPIYKDTSITTYEYDVPAAGKATVTVKNGRGNDVQKTVYDLDADGYLDYDNYQQFPVRTTAFLET